MKVLFVCTGNAGRSQLAQVMFQAIAPRDARVESAGVRPHAELHPMTVPTLERFKLPEPAALHPKSVESMMNVRFDVVVTIGEEARYATLPVAPATQRLHWPVPDPDRIGSGSETGAWNVTAAEISRRTRELAEQLSLRYPADRYLGVPGIATVLFHPEPLVPGTHLPLLKSAGFGLVELSFYFDTPIYDWESRAAISDLMEVCRGEGIDVWSIHPPDRGRLGSPDRSERLLQEDVLIRTAELACEVGATAVVFHALLDRAAIAHDHRYDAKKRLLESLQSVARRVESLPVSLCLETVPAPFTADVHALNNQEILEAISLYAPDGPFCVAIDSGHSNIAGDLVDQPQRAAGRLRSLHINDNDGTSDQHLVPGEGNVDWEMFWANLVAANYAGPLMVEVLARERDAADVARRSFETLAVPRDQLGKQNTVDIN